ncbi:MAG: hypothetical protein K1Y01_10975 [Vicinamibacteria bacterium]|nr:hypothetical protein [Vicinamibacteria bacterium]
MFLSASFAVASLLALPPSGSADPCGANLGEWLKCNNPRVIRYLSGLSKADVGKVLPGVVLTDGTNALKGYTFLGEVTGVGKGAHLYLVSVKGGRRAFGWVDKGGSELSLPECPGSVPGSAYGLNGDVYTWRAIQPEHGVVEAMCVAKAWDK